MTPPTQSDTVQTRMAAQMELAGTICLRKDRTWSAGAVTPALQGPI